jgi:hypothetical protein
MMQDADGETALHKAAKRVCSRLPSLKSSNQLCETHLTTICSSSSSSGSSSSSSSSINNIILIYFDHGS